MSTIVLLHQVKEKLIQLRINAGLTEEEMAHRLDPSYQASIVKAIESGQRSVGITVLLKYMEAFNLDIHLVFNDKE